MSLSAREYTLDALENLLRPRFLAAYRLACASSFGVWNVRGGLVGRRSSIVIAQHKFLLASKQRYADGDDLDAMKSL